MTLLGRRDILVSNSNRTNSNLKLCWVTIVHNYKLLTSRTFSWHNCNIKLCFKSHKFLANSLARMLIIKNGHGQLTCTRDQSLELQLMFVLCIDSARAEEQSKQCQIRIVPTPISNCGHCLQLQALDFKDIFTTYIIVIQLSSSQQILQQEC